MKRPTSVMLAVISILFLLNSCKTIQQNIDARKNLAKCKYEYQKIEYTGFDLNKRRLRGLTFNVLMKISNRASSEVALDHVEADIFLDKHKALQVKHNKFVRIPVGAVKTEPFSMKVPLTSAFRIIGKKPKSLTVKAKIYMTLMLGSSQVSSPIPFVIEKTVPIPWKKINQEVNARLKKLDAKTNNRINKSKKKIKKFF